MFQNCLLLDLTVIDLMSIVHMDEIWVEIAKNFEMRTSGGGGFVKPVRRACARGWIFGQNASLAPGRAQREWNAVLLAWQGGVYIDFGHPRTRGEGVKKRANFCGRPLWMAPKVLTFTLYTCLYQTKNKIDFFWAPYLFKVSAMKYTVRVRKFCRYFKYRFRELTAKFSFIKTDMKVTSRLQIPP